MCKNDEKCLETIVRQAVAGTGAAVMAASPPPKEGSRRRRLWELGGHAHCPIIGVCLPIGALRKMVDKIVGGQTTSDDYDLHCGVIVDCKMRTPLAQAVQRELDRRHMLVLRQAAKAKSVEALATWWHEAARAQDLAGVFWATLTHARCTSALEHHVLGEIHMIQHQIGTALRADLQRFEMLIDENAILGRELGAAQGRCSRLTEEHVRRSELQQGQIVQLRAEVISRDTTIATLREEQKALEAAMPGLKVRFELAREGERHVERIHHLERTLLQSQHEAERQRRRAEDLAAELHRRDTESLDAVTSTAVQHLVSLDDHAVLCVGGRQASIPIYRQLIERTGGRFLHHDGGEQDSTARLDSTLAAADLVICQTGCVSHDAYWRVKNHCKRTGKRCVFVETPSKAALERALGELCSAGERANTLIAATGDESTPDLSDDDQH